MIPGAPDGPPRFLRDVRFHRTLARLWREEPAGTGRLVPGALEHLPSLLAGMLAEDTPDADRQAVLVALLLEAEGEEGEMERIREGVLARLPEILSLLEASSPGGAAPDPARVGALLYLLVQLPEGAEEIERALASAEDLEGWELPTLRQAWAMRDDRPGWARAVVAYLGARAAARIPPDRSRLLRDTLCCPACHGELDFGVDDGASSEEGAPPSLSCVGCGADYLYRGDAMALVRPEDEEVSQFSQDLVDQYEERTRPRFVRVMSGSWDGLLTPEWEERYLEQNLRAGDGAVLDLGCGAGGWTRKVAGLVGEERVIALDSSPAMLAALARSMPLALPVLASATRLPVRSGSLAAVNCSDALQAFPDPEAAVREVARCLKPGAPFTVFTFLEGGLPYRYFQNRFPLHGRTLFEAGALRSLLDQVDLEVTDWGRMSHAVFFTARKR